jgi:hypothetical protein
LPALRANATLRAEQVDLCTSTRQHPSYEWLDAAEDVTERGVMRGRADRWSYRFLPDDIGTTVTLSYDVLRPVSAGLHLTLRLLFGVRDLRADLHQNMQTSVRRLAEVARCEGAGPPSQAQAGRPAQPRERTAQRRPGLRPA